MTNIQIYKKRITALIVISASSLFGVGPTFYWYLLGDSDQFPGIDFMTSLLALVTFLVGVTRLLKALKSRLYRADAPTPPERELKRYFIAWMVPASGPLILAVFAILSLIAGPVLWLVTLQIATLDLSWVGNSVRALLEIVPILFALSWLSPVVVLIWNKLTRK